MMNSLKCTTPGHVFLLSKSSNRIISDFRQAYSLYNSINDGRVDTGVSPVLALQRWCNYYPSMEFCVYLSDYRVIAISQKDVGLYYPFLKTAREHLQSLISSFVETRVKDRFPVKDCRIAFSLMFICSGDGCLY